jgi:SulP family sulfate permease
LIAGMVGGMVVGMASGSSLGVSGPAAGLAVIVLHAIETLGGSWEAFLLSVVLAGVIQLLAGYLKLGTIAYYFPSSVIKGMLTGIGLLIILKQLPHSVGYDADFEGDESFLQPDGQTTFSELSNMLDYISPGAVTITLISLAILLLWDNVLMKKHKIFGIISGPLTAVVAGILLNYSYQTGVLPFTLEANHMVQIPVASTIGEFFQQFTMPDFTQFGNKKVYEIALVMAVVASLETLLSVEATDKLDPQKRVTPANRELKAQGLGNIVSGLMGGLPITQVVVRSSANVTFGGKSKMSAILHGFFLLVSALLAPHLLNMIPLATLASILLMVGYKLAKPSIFKQLYNQDWEQFIPFMATVIAILFSDLLKGIGVGMAFAIFYILRNNIRNPLHRPEDKASDNHHVIMLSEEVSFLNKVSLLQMLNSIPPNSTVVIDGSKTRSIHYDVIEIIQDFRAHAKTIGITLEVKGIYL